MAKRVYTRTGFPETGAALEKYLKKVGKSQLALSRETGIDASAIFRFIKGDRGPDLASAYLIEQATKGRITVVMWAREAAERRREKYRQREEAKRREAEEQEDKMVGLN